MTVGEVFTLPPGDPELSASFLGNGHDELHMAFDFSIMYRLWSARQFYTCIKKWYKALPPEGWPCNFCQITINHEAEQDFLGEVTRKKGESSCSIFTHYKRDSIHIYMEKSLG
jgi:glycosidase